MGTFIDRLNDALKERDAKAADLAKAIGVSEGLISQWKKGSDPESIGSGIFLRACAWLGRSPDYMLYGKGPKGAGPDPSVLARQATDIASLLEVVRSVIEALTLTTPAAGAWIEERLSNSSLRGHSEVVEQSLVTARKALALAATPKPTHQPETSASSRPKGPTRRS